MKILIFKKYLLVIHFSQCLFRSSRHRTTHIFSKRLTLNSIQEQIWSKFSSRKEKCSEVKINDLISCNYHFFPLLRWMHFGICLSAAVELNFLPHPPQAIRSSYSGYSGGKGVPSSFILGLFEFKPLRSCYDYFFHFGTLLAFFYGFSSV